MPRKLSSEMLTHAQLEQLAAIGLSDKEISNLLGISESRWKAQLLFSDQERACQAAPKPS